MDVEAARKDFQDRTWSHFKYDFARLVYVSSLRDYSSGEYHHHGLAQTFSESAANAAITGCHEELFYQILLSPLESLVGQLERFFRASGRDFDATLDAWESLEPENVTMPARCDPIAADLFRSNIKTAKALLKFRQLAPKPPHHPLASPRPLLDR